MKSVLYVEDDPINALVMQKLLKGIYDIRHVVDGETCLALLQGEKFDLILMDINLGKGKMNGIETMHKIKENPATKDIDVITVTSYALPEDEERFLREGFDGYMAKPIDRKLLLHTLATFLD